MQVTLPTETSDGTKQNIVWRENQKHTSFDLSGEMTVIVITVWQLESQGKIGGK
jgi:hypothetical protein